MTRYELAVVVALRDGTDAADLRPSGRGSHRMSNRRRAESGRFETLKDFEWLAGVMGKRRPLTSRPAQRWSQLHHDIWHLCACGDHGR